MLHGSPIWEVAQTIPDAVVAVTCPNEKVHLNKGIEGNQPRGLGCLCVERTDTPVLDLAGNVPAIAKI